jgi:DNA-directed RNA polymerase specialized sigma24 family protein
VIGAEFTGVLHAAQQGRVSAFERLWSDIHPSLIRYLRVVAVADADDLACESWVDVVRRLPAFEGSETSWRAEVFASARMHAEDENQRRVWDAMAEDEQVAAVLAEPLPPGDEPFDDDEVEGGPAQGLRLALEAIRDLPPEQGDVLMLRLVAELPEGDVATLVGSDVATVHALEQQGLDRLGLDAELLGWALAAEPRPVELADEATVLGFFRAMVPERHAPAAVAGQEGGHPPVARVVTLRRPSWRARTGAVAAVSAGVIGLGAISAAAYQGVLPDPVQNVMHVVIGAPEPGPGTGGGTTAAPSPRTTRAAPQTVGSSSTAPTTATSGTAAQVPHVQAVTLCLAWAVERQQGVAPAGSAAYKALVQVAGGTAVDRFCQLSGVSLPPAATAAPAPTATEPSPGDGATPAPPTTVPGATVPEPTTSDPGTTVTEPPTTEPGPTTTPPTTTEPTPPTTTDSTPPTTPTTTETTGSGRGTGPQGSGSSTQDPAGSSTTGQGSGTANATDRSASSGRATRARGTGSAARVATGEVTAAK